MVQVSAYIDCVIVIQIIKMKCKNFVYQTQRVPIRLLPIIGFIIAQSYTQLLLARYTK